MGRENTRSEPRVAAIAPELAGQPAARRWPLTRPRGASKSRSGRPASSAGHCRAVAYATLWRVIPAGGPRRARGSTRGSAMAADAAQHGSRSRLRATGQLGWPLPSSRVSYSLARALRVGLGELAGQPAARRWPPTRPSTAPDLGSGRPASSAGHCRAVAYATLWRVIPAGGPRRARGSTRGSAMAANAAQHGSRSRLRATGQLGWPLPSSRIRDSLARDSRGWASESSRVNLRLGDGR